VPNAEAMQITKRFKANFVWEKNPLNPPSCLSSFTAQVLEYPAVASSKMGVSSQGKKGPQSNDDTKLSSKVPNIWWSWKWQVAFGMVSLVCALYMAMKPRGFALLPESYALCSKQTNKVYTVDDKDTQTQCIVVDGVHIVNTGSLGEFNELSRKLIDLKSTFSCRNCLGPLENFQKIGIRSANYTTWSHRRPWHQR